MSVKVECLVLPSLNGIWSPFGKEVEEVSSFFDKEIKSGSVKSGSTNIFITVSSILMFMAVDIVCKERGYNLVVHIDELANETDADGFYKFYADQMIRLQKQLDKLGHNSKWLSM